MLFLCYPKCSTCQKARKWLDEHGIKYTERHIVEKNPTYDELKVWYQQSGLPIKKFFNTSGLVYKEMQLKDKLLACTFATIFPPRMATSVFTTASPNPVLPLCLDLSPV